METKGDGWRLFLELCRKAEGDQALNELFWLILTPEERQAIQTRALIIRELVRGEKPQRQIAKELGVSIAKITRGSNFLKEVKDDLRSLFS
ncbi:MAG: trp operon repressor [Verrucomicrobia bacterium]|nr:trp operon repressor [Verrucomicrobiota bacterium]MBU6446363.1 trp operon repressor [Verrucomicrobiota bacterium]MDE3047883.1 trp operon repressor [Verrucomicrobiota bacterium]